MTEDELYLALSDPKLTPEEKKHIQETYNNEHSKEGTYGSRD